MSPADLIEETLHDALLALREQRPDDAVRLLRRVGPVAAGAGPLPHAAVLIRLAQARLAQSDQALDAEEAVMRAAQAHAVAQDCLDRLRQAGGLQSSLGDRATRLRIEAADRLVQRGDRAA
jgi:hypothetical protein